MGARRGNRTMMLATLHGSKGLGCSSCKGSCSDCKSLSILSGFCGSNIETLGRKWYERAASAVSDTVSNVADVALTPIKAAGSTVADLASGDFGDVLHDASRVVTGGVLAIPNTTLALTSNVPGLDSVYDSVIGFEERNPEAIALASIAAVATVVSMGGLTPGIMAYYGVTPAMLASVEAGTATVGTTLAVGKALLNSGTLSDEEKGKVEASMDSIYNSGYKEPSSMGWLFAAIPAALAFL